MRNDQIGAFIDGDVTLAGRADGPLAGLDFAVKDLFDIVGLVTGAGNPDWRRTHRPAPSTAPVVQTLLAAGASVTGKTHTDELAFSLQGENAHYGTPVNVRAPERIPGGSSSGSAAAVAGELVDFAIGTDTGGSVRVPASFCGICGMRPSHGRTSLAGCMPLAESFDTVGWFTRDAALLQRVGAVLLGAAASDADPARLLVAADLFQACDPPARDAWGAVTVRIEQQFGALEPVALADDTRTWMPDFRTLLGAEAWRAHGAWIEATKPAFGPDIQQRLDMARAITEAQVAAAAEVRGAATTRMQTLLQDGAVLIMPTTPGAAPFKRTPPAELDAYRLAMLRLTCIAGMARLPQISLPLASVEGAPLGLSLIAGHGNDMALLRFAGAVMDRCQ